MKRKKILSLFLIVLGTAGITRAQVHIGATTDPHDGAILDLTNSQNGGLLLPNVALQQATILTVGGVDTESAEPTAAGMVVYNTNPYALNGTGVYVWEGAKWTSVYSEGKIKATCATCESDYYEVDASKYVDIKVRNTLGSLTDSLTLRFLTYNLGANPNIAGKNATPGQIAKAQMAYTSTLASPAEDITVFGGLYQWGRKDADHSLRCANPDHNSDSDRFKHSAPYSTLDEATSDGRFVWVHENWINPQINNLWGNGGDLAEQINTTYVAPQNDGNPCPAGFRVPTQHEWALLGNEGGSSTDSNNDGFITSGGIAGTTPTSGITWVPVAEGKADNLWSLDGKTCGYALYRKDVWTAADGEYKDGSKSLTATEAPDPLLFLPAAGSRDSDVCAVTIDSGGKYWSSTVSVSATRPWNTQIYSTDVSSGNTNAGQAVGQSVRCVSE
jgi:hypothetical protein